MECQCHPGITAKSDRRGLTHAAVVCGRGSAGLEFNPRGVPTWAEAEQPAVNDSPAGDVMIGCGEAVTIGLNMAITALSADRRATSYLVRRVTADTQRTTPAGRNSLVDPAQPMSRAMSHQKETAREEDRRV